VACGTALSPAGQAADRRHRRRGQRRHRDRQPLPALGQPAVQQPRHHQEREDKEWSGTIKASYRFSPEVFTYASYARGYKGGGFNLDRAQSSNGLPTGGQGVVPVQDTSFPAEFVDSYEIGLKNTLFNRTVLFNITGFYQKFSDFQLNTFLGTSFAVRSVPEVTSKGVDVDFLWFTPVRGLSIQSGLSYADTKYGDTPIANDPGNALALLPGSQMSLAPKWSASGSLTYEPRSATA
jgi:iron complex outermembrane receptor protein